MNKQKLLVSFSGGETSAFMCHILKERFSEQYEMIFVFANTGQENEETLIFADKCDKEFDLGLVWVEAEVHHGVKKGTTHRKVSFQTASRRGEPFEEVIAKYMIPNVGSPHCTRELKERPIKSYARSIGWRDYKTAIGIRVDEIDRVSPKRKELNLLYPLVSHFPVTKPQVNSFWEAMPFRLNLKGYEGNCKTCWKKSFRKLATIAIENPERFDFMRSMEIEYGDYIKPEKAHNPKIKPPIRFFRQNKSIDDIFQIALEPGFKKAEDDSIIYEDLDLDLAGGCSESCEVFS